MSKLWAFNAKVPPATDLRPSRSQDDEEEHGPPMPAQEYWRMAALKRLRHKLVHYCSAKQDGTHTKAKPPVLALERWLSRAALRNHPGDDPLIPSSPEIDPGLIQDLSRTLPSRQAAQRVAELLTLQAHQAVQKLRQNIPSPQLESRGYATVKENVVAVQKAADQLHKLLRRDTCSFLKETTKQLKILSQSTKELSRSTFELSASKVISGTKYNPDENEIHISSARRPGMFDVSLSRDGKVLKPYLTISTPHLNKLLQLWNLHQQESRQCQEPTKTNRAPRVPPFYKDPIKEMNNRSSDESRLLKQSIYSVLARYEALRGAGYQCAVPGQAFDAAAKACGLGTTIECFASPLNCRYRRYCSAFPDIEHVFGSVGSFFDDNAFDPYSGSFEANPPFVPETMTQMGLKLERLLSDPTKGPLSFLVIVPAWGEAGMDFCHSLEESAYQRAATRIPAAQHAFCDGAQHTLRSKSQLLRPSSWDTAVILLQNAAGAKKWPVDTAKLEGVFSQAFKASLDGAQFTNLQAWEQRGKVNGGSERAKEQGYGDGLKRTLVRNPGHNKRPKMS